MKKLGLEGQGLNDEAVVRGPGSEEVRIMKPGLEGQGLKRSE